MRRSAKRTLLAAIALGAGGAAVGGFGAAIGRDVWRATKKRSRVFIVLALVAGATVLPFIGGRNITRGYADHSAGPIIGGIFMVISGGALGLLACIILYGYQLAPLALLVGVAVIASTLVGLLHGAGQRPARMRMFAIAEQNERFLEELGFEEVDESEVTHFDGEGNPLRLMERTDDSIVFMAVGRRSRRAYIRLSPQGEMLGYTGVIALTDQRQYRDPSGVSLR